ncbi:MAG: beta-galactosidase [Chloroflexota bacterium]
MNLGACYYPEQWPEKRWPVDARLMVEAGLELVRIAEFAWAKMEPSPGTYDWDWLDRAIDILARAGLQVILGTPTATPPAWLTQAYPDSLRVDSNGRRRKHGSRRHACVNHGGYRDHSRRIVRAMAERYGRDPRIIGWQIDNEFGGGKTARCYCKACAARFRRWLRDRYQTLDALNEAWGAVFWSQTYSDWEQVQLPDETIDKANPSQELDYYRFASESYVEFQLQQIEILRANTSGFITHNFMGLYRDLDQFDLARPLDFVTWDNYPTGNPDRWRSILYPPGRDTRRNDPLYAYDAGDPIITSMAHALMRGLKGAPFWIMEQQCGLINWGEVNPGIREGTTRLWTWHALAEGAEACLYFRWRPTLFAQEQYHSGLLRHDGEPAQGLRDVESMRGERGLMAAVAAEPWRAEVAMLIDYDDLWALELQPQRRGFHYLRHLFVYYEVLQKLGVAVDLVSTRADLNGYKMVLAPTLHLPDETVVNHLSDYVHGGGTLLLGLRSGFKTPTNLVTGRPLPGLLRPLSGLTVTSWQSLPDGIEVELSTDIPGLDGGATIWYETLEPDMAAVIGRYETGEAALCEHTLGAGRVTTVGWYPTPEQAGALLDHLLAQCAMTPATVPPPGCLVLRRGPYTILLNFSEQAHAVEIKDTSIDLPPREVWVI